MTTDLARLREHINQRIELGIDGPRWKAVELTNQQALALLDELESLKAENEQLKHERDCWKAGTNIVIRGKP